jgi:hypothetical protein
VGGIAEQGEAVRQNPAREFKQHDASGYDQGDREPFAVVGVMMAEMVMMVAVMMTVMMTVTVMMAVAAVSAMTMTVIMMTAVVAVSVMTTAVIVMMVLAIRVPVTA